jgi:mannose-6-phosphate isomerase
MSLPDPHPGASEHVDEPLLFERVCLEKVWGGRALEQTPGIPLSSEGPVGETWELSDHVEHSSVVRNGVHAGRTLHDLVRDHRDELLGSTKPTEQDRFPLLVKYLSASQPLSVQVHPDDRTAKNLHAGESGKDESWLILAAEPGSLVYLGLREGVDPASLAALASTDGVVDLLQPWTVEAGQVIDVPAGTLHAIGAGVTLAEVQQSSDLTYRLYDWGRTGLDGKPRETHAEQALLAIDYVTPVVGPLDPVFVDEVGARRAQDVISGRHYALSLLEVSGHVDADTQGSALVYVVVEGGLRLDSMTRESSWELSTGDTWLLPAAVGAHRLTATTETSRLIVVTTRN